jgi:DNA-binding NtrC family response regulator
MSETILVVEDETSQRTTLANFIRQDMNMQVIETASGGEAINILLSQTGCKPSAMILDYHMPGLSGLDVLENIRPRRPGLPIIMLTSNEKADTIVGCMRAGATDYMLKPFSRERMRVTLLNALKMQSLSEDALRYTRLQDSIVTFADIVGFSPSFTKAVQAGTAASLHCLPLLLQGEHGSGKEWFARAIHGASARRGKPFVAVDAKSTNASLVEARLFGMQATDFTQGTLPYAGKWSHATGGTLYIGHIDRLPHAAQANLIKLLQETEETNNVRLIAGTEHSLGKLEESGLLRSDLRHLLEACTIRIPPLREREGDVLHLAEHLLRLYSATEQKPLRGFDESAKAILKAYPWPGNIRELESTLLRASILCRSDQISGHDLLNLSMVPPMPANDGSRIRKPSSMVKPMQQEWLPLLDQEGRFRTMEKLEEAIMQRALEMCKGCISDAARVLGVGRSTLYRRLNIGHEAASA